MKLELDHIAIAANSLSEGVAFAERALGVTIPAGGVHPQMGTHNHLLRLGDDVYLEVIAPDPTAQAVSRPRWFALDDPQMRAALSRSPRVVTWLVRTDDIAAALAAIPGAVGPAIRVTRGQLAWQISVPPDGSMPYDGAFPTLIEWPRGSQPASRMPASGCSLLSLDVIHPRAEEIAPSLRGVFTDPRVRISTGAPMKITMTIATPAGPRQLS